MASAHDVAAYILERSGTISTWKLQKLVYYSQAWHLAWEEEPLFGDGIEAWANGPVVRALYNDHRGRFAISAGEIQGASERLSPRERSTIDLVLGSYGSMAGRQLSQLTHAEAPWNDARAGLRPTDPSTAEITPESMFEYYSALDADDDAPAVDELDWDALEAP